MSTLFQAPQYDPAKDRRRRKTVVLVIAIVVVIAALLWTFRHWPQEHKVNQFFTAIEQKNFEKAYAIYWNDPNWKQHPQNYARYTFQDFYNDWGPGGDWGIIRSHKVEGTVRPSGGGSGVVVKVSINDRKTPACIWVDQDGTITAPSPIPCA
jgi:hypothetical protein